MKKMLLWSVLALLTLSIVSCSDDNDNEPDSNELVGTWRMTTFDYDGTSTTIVAGQSTTANFVGTAFDIDAKITFLESPNEYKTEGTYGINLMYSVSGQNYETQATVDGFLDSGDWERDGDTIKVTNADGEVSEATIVTLNGTTLVLDAATSETTIDPSSGITTIVEAEGTYTFERL
ncbi:MAG: lipocalin family protein [Chitinophagales bacterium]|nr:lipocalin family protein [Chitinophagales bacterium]